MIKYDWWLPTEEELEKSRKLRFKEKNFEYALLFILKYVVFLTILSIVAYGNRNTYSHHYFANLQRNLNSTKLYVSIIFLVFEQ